MTMTEAAVLCAVIGYGIGLLAGILWERERAESVRRSLEGEP